MVASRFGLGALVGLVVLSLFASGLGSAHPAPSSAPSPGTSPPTYPATFNETGLPAATNWSVHVGFIGCGCSGVHTTVNSTTPSISVPLPNGSYRYRILPVAGYVVSGLAHGTLTVAGAAPPVVPVVFTRVTTYPTEFSEVGLPSGTSWTVAVAGNGVGQIRALEHESITTALPSMNFSLPNATYHYTVSKVNGSFFDGPSHGSFVVAGASPAATVVHFLTPPVYEVAFAESGLIAGMSWSVALHGRGTVPVHQASTSTGGTNAFFLPNGTYYYRVGVVLGFGFVGPSTGSFTVSGAPVAIGVSFAELGSSALFLVSFNETGLAAGTHWTIRVAAEHTFGRASHEASSSTSPSVTFALPNGTYRYHVPAVRGYTLGVSTGVVSVAGAAAPPVLVTFVPIPTYSVTFNETGLPNGTNWSVLVRTQTGAWSAWPVHVVETTNSTALVFTIPNGTYCYRFLAVHGWHISTGMVTSSFVVSGGSPPTVFVTFSSGP